MKWKQGKGIDSIEAFLKMANGEVVWYHNAPTRLAGRVEFFHDGKWRQSYIYFIDDFYEAIEVTEYNLNFMEAWEEMKKGKTVERDDNITLYFDNHIARSPHGSQVLACTAVVEGKYRVVEGA